MLETKAQPARTGRSDIARSAATAIRFMSNALVKEMASQCVSKAVQNGFNIMVTIPAGPLSSDFRRSCVPLLATGAVSRPKNYAGAINSADGSLTVVIHHEMVDILIKKHIALAKETASARLARFHTHLYRAVRQYAPENAYGSVVMRIPDLHSVTTIHAKVAGQDRHGSVVGATSHVKRELVQLLRGIVAPYNLKSAEVSISFDKFDERSMVLSVNGNIIEWAAPTMDSIALTQPKAASASTHKFSEWNGLVSVAPGKINVVASK